VSSSFERWPLAGGCATDRTEVDVKVKVKQFAVDMEVKTNGIELEVREPDDSAQIGDCYVTKTGLTWCRGKTTKANGIKVTWSELSELLGSKKAKEQALKAARNA
jgi:hypothetical protein